MPLLEIIQSLIHKLEVGAGVRFFRVTAILLAVVALAMRYDFHAYQNLTTPEGMDAAQLARNISDGKGYTTLFLRPLSLYLVQRHNEAGKSVTATNADFDFARVKTAHPDLANPPVYPVVLAGLMKVLPFHYAVNTTSSFWSQNNQFERYEPDFLIALFNQLLLVAAVVLTFFLARKLFDTAAAWLSAILMLGSALLWRFSVSGLSTLLLLVIFLGLTWCILKIEAEACAPQPRQKRLLSLAVVAGALTGLGALTRYAFGWTILPVIVFLILFSGPRRVRHVLAAIGVFAIMLAPWIVRNIAISGTPFGTAGYAVAEGTYLFPGSQLERSVHPDLNYAFALSPLLHKLLGNASDVVQRSLAQLGGGWTSMWFLTGLMLGFRNQTARRVRYFLLMCLGAFVVVQLLNRPPSTEPPAVNPENLLVLLAPLVFVFGVAFFFTLLDQMALPVIQLRHAIAAGFVLVSCLPMLFVLLWSPANPVAYPPYYPPDIQRTAGWMKPDELMMSDVPWAVAWYGQRQCVWLTLNSGRDFDAINDWIKPVQAIYFTPETMDAKFFSDIARGEPNSWGRFILQVGIQNQFPQHFPLRYPRSMLSGLFVADSPRWKLGPQ